MTRESLTRLFDTVGPRFGDRNGGYLRITRNGFRKGDGGETVFIELLGAEKFLEKKRKKSAAARAKRVEAAKKQMEEAGEAEASEKETKEDRKDKKDKK